MSLNPMSGDRHEHLVKCAEEVIGLMNIGTDADAALLKVARDGELSSSEVDRVSHAVNNSKTVAVLRSEKGEDRGKPFQLTNADTVKTHLFDGAFSGSNNGGKKEASESYVDSGTYLDSEPVDHLKTAREIFGTDDQVQTHQKLALCVDEHLNVSLETEGSGRLIDNPYAKLGHLKHRIDEASAEYTRHRDLALSGIDKLAHEFSRVDTPNFRDVEKLAGYLGCSQDTLELIFSGCELERHGHQRATGEKLAGLIAATPRANELAKLALAVETSWKTAADYQTVRDRLVEGRDRIEAELTKQANTSGFSQEVENLPKALTGAGVDTKGPVELIGSAMGNYSDKGPELQGENSSPFDVQSRQGSANIDARAGLDELLSDPYIQNHPIQDVVDAYNKIKSVNPNLGTGELGGLIRQALAQDGQLGTDTMSRLRGK